MRPGLLLLALALFAACGRAGDSPQEPVAISPDPQTTPVDADPEPEPIVFDTTEPPPPVVEIPVQAPPPVPVPQPPPQAPEPAPAPGSCDVRETESFCFTYTGTGWTAEDAEAQCSEAPASSYRQSACPTANRIGTCIFRRPSDPTLEVVYTYYAPYDVDIAEVACPGEFTRH
ncbi:MAG: hypothetical protein AAF170_12985 [Bacteroidota bacterium]